MKHMTEQEHGCEKLDQEALPNHGNLLAALWQNPTHVHYFGVRDPVGGYFETINVEDVKTAEQLAVQYESQGKEVYHACACFDAVDGGRKANNALGAYAFWVDIDCGLDKAKSGKGYANEVLAKQALKKFCGECNLPYPNKVVHSGGGVHAYWVVDALILKEDWREYAQKLKALAAKSGFLADPSRTADIASLLRVPGTLNHKYDPARPVMLVESEKPLIERDALLEVIDRAWSKLPGNVAATAKPVAAAPATAPAQDHFEHEFGHLDLKQVTSAFKVLDPDCDDFTWKFYRLAVLASLALQHPDNADALKALARDWSSGTLRGTPSKAWNEPGSSNGKTGAQVFEEVWKRFSDPGYTDKSATLGTVFMHAKEQGWNFAKASSKLSASAPPEGVKTTEKTSVAGDPVKPLPFGEIAPWHEPVDPAALFSEASQAILRFVVMEPELADATVLWAVHTHLFEKLDISPLLLIDAPERACAKTLLQTVVSWLSFRPLPAANASLSAVFRAIELWGVTLFIDEADTFFKENKELQGVVNAGYKRGGVVLRAEVNGDGYEPKIFSVYGPKCIAGIALGKHMTDATMSRGIVINMRRKMTTEKVERIRGAQQAVFALLAAKFARFALDYAQAVADARPELPSALSDRAQDNWESLLAIATCAGPHWVDRATKAAIKLSSTSESQGSASNDLLSDIREVLVGWEEKTIPTVTLINRLCRDPEMEWDTYNRGKDLSSRQLSKYLSVYGLAPRTVRQKDGKTPKGYYIEEFEEVFARYLKPVSPEDITP